MQVSDIPKISSIDRYEAMSTKWKIAYTMFDTVGSPMEATSRKIYEIFKHLTTVRIL